MSPYEGQQRRKTTLTTTATKATSRKALGHQGLEEGKADRKGAQPRQTLGVGVGWGIKQAFGL